MVTIESAHRTEYSKNPDTGDEVIIFSGDVSLKVSKNGQNIEIQAESIVYNRAKSILYAEGDITFSRSSEGSSTEKLTAQTLLFNIDTLEGIFDQGRVVQEQSDSINLPSGSSLYVSSDLFGRDNSGTVVFDTGTLTFCDDPDPHWQIKASRIWLLPGNEFSFLNAVLYVGHLPVMYFPFFYYPKDEMVFNPVFSYDARRGYSLQTTTYIIGRKPLAASDDDEGLFSFMRTTELKKQERDGLFLRNLDEDDKPSTETLKIVADLYSNLGFMTGVEGVFKPESVIKDISFKTYIGFSNTLFPAGGQYTTYSPLDGRRYYDWSYLLGLKIPFRFYSDFSMKVSWDSFTLNVTLPLYSDSSFADDFLVRSENMDWINYLLKNPVLVSDSSSSSGGSSKSSFSWNLSGSFSTPSFIKNLNPYISSFSVSSLSSSVNFSSKTNTTLSGTASSYTPGRTFFYPSSIYPLKMSVSIQGTLLSSKTTSSAGSSSKGSSSSSSSGKELELEAPPELTAEKTPESDYEKIPADAMPALTVSGLTRKTVSALSYSLTYSMTPSITTEMHYDADRWRSPSEIDWSDMKSSYLLLKSPLTIKDSVTWKNNFLSLTNSFTINPEFQNHPVVSDTVYPEGSSALESLLKSDYQARKLDVSAVNALTLKPFVLTDTFADTSLTWNSTIKLVRTKFNGSTTDPSWNFNLAQWNPESITSHDMTLVLSAKDGAFNPKFTLKANLPPQVESYTGTLSFGYGVLSSFSISSAYKRKSKTDSSWVFTPLTQSSSWSFGDKTISVSESFKYNIEDNHSDTLSLSVSGFGLTASYSMGWTKPYELISGQGWIMQNENEFIPKTALFTYSIPAKTLYSWYNRISFAPSLSTSINLDLIRPTDSSFVFTPAFTFKINKALDVTFSAESRNQVLFRYIQNLYDYDVKMPGETNLLVDLFDSFAFWNTDLRKASGFKLKKISIKLTHELHDWVLNSEFKIEPRLLKDTTPYHYDFSPYFSLSVVWRPMSSMKTTIQDKYGTFVLNPD